MPVQVKDPTNIQSAYDESADPTAHTSSALSDAEQKASDAAYVSSGIDQLEAYANDPANHIKDAEEGETSTGSWAVNRSNGKDGSSISRGQKVLKGLKKSGPFGAIIGIIVGGAGIVSFFGGPGLLIVNFAEVITDKLNYQLGVMDARYSKIVEAKLKNTTSGVCTSLTSRLCKYSTFSDKEIANFEKAGLKVNESGSSITGRTKVDSFEIDVGGETKTITAGEFKSAMKNIPEFKSAMKSAYNMKYLGTSDSIFSKALSYFKTSKAKPFNDSDSDEERATELEDKTKNGTSEADLKAANVCDKADECTDEEKARNGSGANNATEAVDDATSNSDSVANRVLNEASDVATEGTEEAAEEVATKAAQAGAKTAWEAGSSTIKITGIADNVCMVYGWVKGFSFAAKAIRAAEIARYAMMFLSTASMIKAGVAKADDVSYLGNLMTKVVTINGKSTKSATDSIGYRSLAYGDKGTTNSSLNAVAGASFPPLIQGAIDTIINTIGKKGIDQTCHVLANPFVQAGSLIVGVASFFAGIGEVKFTAQMVIAPVIALIGAFLPTMLGEILAGKVVTASTFGEVTGDLIASGTGGLLSKSSSIGGGAVLTRTQATAYMQYQNQVAADYAEYDRQTLSPFDASNPNTFLGSIYTQLTPYLNNTSSVTGAISSIGSIVLSSMSNIVSPTTSAATTDNYDSCTDMAVTDLNMATDVFCNPVTGIPTQYLNEEPETVYNNLVSSGDIDADGNPTSQRYKDLISNCIERQAPYGVSNADEVDNTDSCFINDQTTAEMYLFRADGRIVDALEGDTGSDNAADTTPDAGGSVSLVDPSQWAVAKDSNGTINKGSAEWKRWKAAIGGNGKSSTGVLTPIAISGSNICSQSNSLNQDGGGNLFNPNAAASAKALIEAYNAAHSGKYLVPGACFRSIAGQQKAWNNYKAGGNLAAEVGTSNHGWGLAADWRISTTAKGLGESISSFSSSDYLWMKNNAYQFGWVNPLAMTPAGGCTGVKCEPWHFQYVGPLYGS